jgi:hypothetical protein
MKIFTRKINFKKVVSRIIVDGHDIDLTKTCVKGNIEKINRKHERKFKAGHAKFEKITGTCGCCMRSNLTINKTTGRLSAHNDLSGKRCWGSNTQPLEISDEGIIEGIRFFYTVMKTVKLHLKTAKGAFKSQLEREYKEALEMFKVKVDLLISYRDLEAKRRAAEKAAKIKAAKKAAKKAARAAKKAANAKKTEQVRIKRNANATCPRCGTVAKDTEQVDALFGYRKRKDGSLYPQSYCRCCRKEMNAIYRAKKKATIKDTAIKVAA